jgi:hypothetical protein
MFAASACHFRQCRGVDYMQAGVSITVTCRQCRGVNYSAGVSYAEQAVRPLLAILGVIGWRSACHIINDLPGQMITIAALLAFVGVLGLILIVIVEKTLRLSDLAALGMALSNTFGLSAGMLLMGYGLVEIPREMWKSDPNHLLKWNAHRWGAADRRLAAVVKGGGRGCLGDCSQQPAAWFG